MKNGSSSTSVSAPGPVQVDAKYKLKTRKAAAKRFQKGGAGKLVRRCPGKSHLNEKKTSNRKKKLSNKTNVHDTVVRMYV